MASPMHGENKKATFTTTTSSSLINDLGTSSLHKAFVFLGRMLLREKVHVIVDGDSLEWLAEKYGTTVAALQKLNNLEGDTIYAGSVLKISTCRDRGAKALRLRKASLGERNAICNGIPMDFLPTPSVAKVTDPLGKVVSGSWKLRKQKPSSRSVTVKVKYGDTLADIASRCGTTIRELQQLNNLRDEAIYEGEMLVISHDMDLRSGKRRTARGLFSRINPANQSNFAVEEPRFISLAGPSIFASKPEGRWKRKERGFQQMRDKWSCFCSPLRDGYVSSPFGWRWGVFHEGVDLAANQGAPILASDRGVVTFAGWSGGYGYLVAIRHKGGFVTRYAHCSAIHARVGQQVLKGQQVAAVGTTGHSTGPHLHFEVRHNGEALDPFKWVDF